MNIAKNNNYYILTATDGIRLITRDEASHRLQGVLQGTPAVGQAVIRFLTDAEIDAYASLRTKEKNVAKAAKKANAAAAKKAEEKAAARKAWMADKAARKAANRAAELERGELRLIARELKKLEADEPVRTDDDQASVLVEAGIPLNVALDVTLVFPPYEMKAIANSEDAAKLRVVRNVGLKRAEAIVKALKGRIVAENINVKVPAPEMHKVQNLNLVTDETGARLTKKKVRRDKLVLKDGEPVDDVALKRFGPALQYAAKLNGTTENLVFTTISQVNEAWRNPVRAILARERWADIAKAGITVKGTKYVPVLMGTNANMKCQVHWLPERMAAAVRNYAICGGKVRSNTNIAKLEAYIGLMLPYTKDLLAGALKPSMEVLIPEFIKEHKGKNMLIDPDGSMKLQNEFSQSEFDGEAYVELTEEILAKFTRSERRRIMRAVAKFNGGTLRAPLQKGCVVGNFPIHEVLRQMGVFAVEGKPINQIALFGDKTVFKAALGDDGLFEKFEEYCANFEEMGHRFGMLLENHGVRGTYLPAQQLQAAHGADKKYIEEGGKAEVEYLKAAQDPKEAARRYMPKAIAEIAQEDERITGVWFAAELAKTGYQKEKFEALSGATHANSLGGFVIKDPIAFCEWIAYCEGVRKELPQGVVKAYQVLCPMAGYTGRGVASRNPVIANYGLVPVDVIERTGTEWDWALEGLDFAIVGIHDDLCKRLRMDHDGDKIRLTTAEWFVKAVESIAETLFAEWNSFGEAVKNMCTWEDTKEFFATRTVTPQLGANVNFAGRLIAAGLTDGIVKPEEAEWLMDYMMNKGTDVKQGADGSSCDGKAGEIWNKLRKGLKDLTDKGVPEYTIAQAYGKHQKDGEFPESKKVAKQYGDSNLDIVSKAVREGAPTGLLLPKGFQTDDVITHVRRSIPGLCGSGSRKNGYADAGLFNRMVAAGKDDLKEMDENAKTVGYDEYVAYKRQQAMEAFEAFAEERGLTMSDIYDGITTYVFDTLSAQFYAKKATEKAKRWYVVLAVTYLSWFGDKMEETYCANKALKCLKAVKPAAIDFDDID